MLDLKIVHNFNQNFFHQIPSKFFLELWNTWKGEAIIMYFCPWVHSDSSRPRIKKKIMSLLFSKKMQNLKIFRKLKPYSSITIIRHSAQWPDDISIRYDRSLPEAHESTLPNLRHCPLLWQKMIIHFRLMTFHFSTFQPHHKHYEMIICN